MFLFTVGFTFFVQFFQVYLLAHFSFNQSQIGDLFGYVGIWIAISQGLMTRVVTRYLKAESVLKFSLLLAAVSFPILLIPNKAIYLYLLIPIASVFNGISLPNANAVISNLSDKETQGEIMGINQSIQSLGQAIPPIISGLAVAINTTVPIYIAGLITFFAWLIYIAFFKSKDTSVYHYS